MKNACQSKQSVVPRSILLARKNSFDVPFDPRISALMANGPVTIPPLFDFVAPRIIFGRGVFSHLGPLV